MDKLKEAIAEIELQGKNYKKFSNEWNIMQQLIDIVVYMPESAELVLQDLKIKEMQLTALVKKITSKRLANPMKITKEICDFYKIEVPNVLPLEHWRSGATKSSVAEKPSGESKFINLMDLL